jgi:hypothetical protein
MSSILKVDTIQDQDGNNIINENANTITIGASGDTITIPSGATFASTGIDDNATSTAITIDSSGNVGIGTSSPSAELHISKSADAGNAEFLIENSFVTAGSTDEIVQIQGRFGGFDASYIITGKEADFTTSGNRSSFMSFWTRGAGTLAEAMRINSSGNVGIGTSSPTEVLHVVGDILATGGDFKSDANNYLGFSNNTFARFVINDSEKMRIDSSGNVGIGTTSPNSYSDYKAITLNGTTGGILDLSVGGTRTGSLVANSTGVNLQCRTAQPLKFETNAVERMRINSSGQTLIGTTVAPDNANTKLMVHTPISSSSLNVIEMSHNTNGANKAGAALGLSIGNGGEATNAASLLFKTASNGSLGERMRISPTGEVSIASSNVTQNSHFNVRQDNNSHATRTYLNANIASGALHSIKYLGTIPAVSLGTQLIIPFISQNNIGSKTYVHIRGMSCESNTTNPKAFDCKFAVGHINNLSNLTVLQNLGTCTGASISGMNIVLAFSVDYTHAGDSGMFIEIDYIAHHQDASINLSGIVMN